MLSFHTAEHITSKVKMGFEVAVLAPIVFLGFSWWVFSIDPRAVGATLTAIAALSPIWLPLFLGKYFWITWMHYVRFKFWFAQETTLLQIQLPPEVEKTPLAMELFLTALWNSGGEVTFIKRLWLGTFRPVWSLEIASIEGNVNFYLHLRKSTKSVVEARIYGQFPGAQVREVEDYTRQVPFNIEEYDMWGCEYRKGDPQAMPIKTYVDYKLDKEQEEEYKVDPITNILELLATMKKDEYLWYQIVCKARKNKQDEWYGFYLKRDSYKESYKKGLADIMKGAAERAAGLVTDEAAKAQAAARGLTLLTPGERTKLEAMERALEKVTFECGIRVFYFAKKSAFRHTNIPNLPRFFDAFASNELNIIKPTRWMAGLDYPWQDFKDIRKNSFKKKLYFLYQNRAYFYVPHDQAPMFLSVEELATIWHFPGSGVKTPGLNRVASKLAEPPPQVPGLPV